MKPLYPSRVSSQLLSQTMSKFLVNEILWRFDRQVWETYSVHRISVEPWANGLRVYGEGVRGGLISYKDFASILKDEARLKAEQLAVQKKGQNFWLVQGSQKPWYAVMKTGNNHGCECMRFRCWQNRMVIEFPELFKALNQRVFCHHTVAVRLSEGYDALSLY